MGMGNSAKHSKLKTKLSKIQNDESVISKKYANIKHEAVELKAIFDCLYGKLSIINDELMTKLNNLQKRQFNESNHHQKKNESLPDDTLKAAKILDDFSVNELENIMHCKENERNMNVNACKSKMNKIAWNMYE